MVIKCGEVPPRLKWEHEPTCIGGDENHKEFSSARPDVYKSFPERKTSRAAFESLHRVIGIRRA